MPAPKGNKNAKGNDGGRPTLYKDEYADQVYKLCLLGATDDEIAEFFGVAVSTVNLWKIEHIKFSESIKAGKTIADGNVADRLYQRALGYEHPSEEIKVVSLGAGAGSAVERVAVTKVYPPDPTAAIFWLKNRQGKKWRDKQEVEHTGTINENKPDLSKLSVEELKVWATLLRKSTSK